MHNMIANASQYGRFMTTIGVKCFCILQWWRTFVRHVRNWFIYESCLRSKQCDRHDGSSPQKGAFLAPCKESVHWVNEFFSSIRGWICTADLVNMLSVHVLESSRPFWTTSHDDVTSMTWNEIWMNAESANVYAILLFVFRVVTNSDSGCRDFRPELLCSSFFFAWTDYDMFCFVVEAVRLMSWFALQYTRIWSSHVDDTRPWISPICN
jgi:hypothetical protein